MSDRSVRLWLRSDVPGPFELMLGTSSGDVRRYRLTATADPDADGTCAFTVPDDVPDAGPLIPETWYAFRIATQATGETIGEGRFATAPSRDSSQPFTFAIMSCHQPFRSDGALHPDSARMMSALDRLLGEREISYALLIGDQVYADEPVHRRIVAPSAERPRLEATVSELRAEYQQCYRRYWAFPEMQRLQAQRATWLIWDDHEIVNDWGALREHQKPSWQKVFTAARLAFADYQGSRDLRIGDRLPPAFHQAFVWGDTATFILDLSSERQFDGHRAQVYGPEQLDALEDFLVEHRDRAVLFVVVTVPLVFLPDWVVALGERVPGQAAAFAARWNAARNAPARQRLFELFDAHLRAAPEQKLVLLAGDIHEAAAISMQMPGGAVAYQFVSSAVTNTARTWKEQVAQRLSYRMARVGRGATRVGIDLLPGVARDHENPFRGLNVGLVTVAPRGEIWTVRYEVVTSGSDGTPKTAFDSGPL